MGGTNDEASLDSLKLKLDLVREARSLFGEEEAKLVWRKLRLSEGPGDSSVGRRSREPVLDKSISAFISKACVVTGYDDDEERSEDLYGGYRRFAAEHELAVLSKAVFQRRLPQHTRQRWPDHDGTLRHFRRTHSNGTIYRGIRLRDVER